MLDRIPRPPRPLPWLGTCIICFLLGCHGGSNAALPPTFQVRPATATVAQGQSFSFSATSSLVGAVPSWTVTPAGAGWIDSAGLFIATAPSGTATLVASWQDNPAYTASARITLVPAPAPAVTSPGLVQAAGTSQSSAGNSIANAPVTGEPTLAQTSASASGAIQVRHGFDPQVQNLTLGQAQSAQATSGVRP
jgi:hypothetical protein